MYKRFVKRFFDFVIAIFCLLLFSPLMLVVAFLIKAESRGPIIFNQERLGFKGKIFTIKKFRTMKTDSENSGTGVYSMIGDPRVTLVGKILRATSIDELPQLFNILKGEMSLIGPRPPLTYHPWKIDCYSDFQKKMFDVLPGITGWAQTHGRKSVEWNDRIELNIWYVDHISFSLDFHICYLTFFKILRNEDNVNSSTTV
jgi:lipopolysaccharide/colanic/teichoic acid biosynthesis glycosyltransferase